MSSILERLFNLENKRIMMTGAAGFLGSHITEAFLEAGADVVLLSRSNRLAQAANVWKERYVDRDIQYFQVDFYDDATLRKVLQYIVDAYRIDVLVNNACDLSLNTGFNTPDGRLEDISREMWEAAIESGIYWAVLTTQIIGRKFIQQKCGNIINISSMYGVVAPNPQLYENTDFHNPPSYSISKSGIIALTKYTASFWGRYGIRCNAVAPGPFPNLESETSNSVTSDDPFIERLMQRTLLKRVGKPEDLHGALIYLASNASSFVTGQTLIVDGGWTVT